MWSIGDSLGDRWEVFDIKYGGMGVVYLVYDRKTELPMAAKTYSDEIPGDRSIAEQFIREATIWVNLDFHPNIVQAHQIHEFRGKPYIFLEYVSGGSLDNWIGTRRVTDDPSFTLGLALDLCDAMVHAARKGLEVHRDIKPQNCLLTEEGTLKLGDFGIARFFSEAASWDRTTGTSTPFGTPKYMAPEQFDSPRIVDVRSDIYAFGVTLFELASGEPLFNGSSWGEYEHLHKTALIPPLPSRYSFLTPLLTSCLQKDRAMRAGSFVEIRDALTSLYQELTLSTKPIPLVEELDNDQIEIIDGVEDRRIIRIRDQDASGKRKYFMLDADHFSNKAISLRRLGQNEEALEACNTALEMNIEFLQAWLNKSSILCHLGRHVEALDCINHVIEVTPSSESAWTNKGVILDKLERYSEAVESFDRALSFDSKNAITWLGRGQSLEHMGRLHEALHSYREALRCDPSLHQAWAAKADLLLHSKEFKGDGTLTPEYVEAQEKTVETNPLSSSALINRGSLFCRQGNINEGLNCFNLALRINPSEPEGWYNRAFALDRLGRIAEALFSIDRALHLNPRLKDAWGVKGNLLLQQGRFGYALACFDRALNLNPSDRIALLGRAAAQEGQRKVSDEE